MASHNSKKPLVVIVGVTASGKSALAINIAELYNGEIISADSMAIYKDFTIGVAKATDDEILKVPHHILTTVNPQDSYNVALFKKQAIDVIDDIQQRHKLPIMVGGTGLYIDSVLYDYDFLPAPNVIKREELNKKSISELHGYITRANFNTNGIDMHNKRRLIRLIETDGQRTVKKSVRPDTLIIGIRIEREALHNRVKQRVDKMITTGLEAEVKTLALTYGWDIEPMKGIGYREWREYFNGSQTLEQTRHRIISGTMYLAKRQRTWFKRNDSIQWVNNPEESFAIVTTFLNKYK